MTMQMLLSTIFLICTVSFILWWSLIDVPLALSPEITTDESSVEETAQSTSTTPIDAAEEARKIIESKNPFALDLSEQGLTKVPDSVFEKTDLESLNLSHNTLSGALQAEVRQLQNLKSLDLSANNFTGVPAEIGQLKNLEVLNLSHNQLTGLPYELGNLSKLKILNLRGNNYSKVDLAIIKERLPKTTTIITD